MMLGMFQMFALLYWIVNNMNVAPCERTTDIDCSFTCSAPKKENETLE